MPTTQRNLDLSGIKEELARISVLLERITQTSEENNRALRGSNGVQGLVSEVHSLGEELQNHINNEKTCPIFSISNLVLGKKGEPGFDERLRNLEDWQKTIKYWTYLLIGTIAASLIKLTFDLFKS